MGAIPVTPHWEAGSRIEPPVSVPIDSAARPAATAAADPPLLPPGLCAGCHGLNAGPVAHVVVAAPIASSSIVARPSSTAPAARSRATTGASRVARDPSWAREPEAVTSPPPRRCCP